MITLSDKVLSKRILALFILTSLILILQGIYNIYSLDGVNKSITQVYDSVDQVSTTSTGISLPISEIRQLSMSLVMAPNKTLREELKSRVIELKNKTAQTINENHITFSDPQSRELFIDIKTAWTNYANAVNVTLAYVKKEVRIAEFISVTVYEKKAYDSVTVAIVAYNAYQLKTSAKILQNAQENALIAFWAVLITTVIEVLTLKFILTYVLNLVRQYVAQRKQHAEELMAQDAALIKSEKMASLGRLVAGIAHELNTPIGVSVTAVSCLQEKVNMLVEAFSTGKIKKRDMDKIICSITQSSDMILYNLERASEQISNFKLVAVDVSSEIMRSFNLHDYITAIAQSLYAETNRGDHEICIEGDSELVIETNPGSISQVITNLVLNSVIHAYEHTQRGTIVIRFFREADDVRLIYSDNGKGMDENTVNMIFEPFYTTKRGDGGSGLGMHIVHNIVTQSLKGKITCISSPDKGMTIDISFPTKSDNAGDEIDDLSTYQ